MPSSACKKKKNKDQRDDLQQRHLTAPDLTTLLAPTRYDPFFFFFNDTATTEIYTLSLHDALPIYDVHPYSDLIAGRVDAVVLDHIIAQRALHRRGGAGFVIQPQAVRSGEHTSELRHSQKSYAVFCL